MSEEENLEENSNNTLNIGKGSSEQFSNLDKYIKEKNPKYVSIFTHKYPDPDAIASMMSLQWVLKNKYNCDSSCYFDGEISHPQNIAMVNLLEPNIKPISELSRNENKHDLSFLVDTNEKNIGNGDFNFEINVVIDHHRLTYENSDIFVNIKSGSCSSTIYKMIKDFNLNFDINNENDISIITALLIGVNTDTDNMMSDETTKYDFETYSELFEYADKNSLKKIVDFERPKSWVNLKARSSTDAKINDGISIVGMGVISPKNRDVIADMSSEMIRWEEVHTSIAFALVDGKEIEGSVRSTNASIPIPKLCSSFGGKYGHGGGKLGKGGYKYSIGGASLDEEENDDLKQDFWQVLKEKEERRLFKILTD